MTHASCVVDEDEEEEEGEEGEEEEAAVAEEDEDDEEEEDDFPSDRIDRFSVGNGGKLEGRQKDKECEEERSETSVTESSHIGYQQSINRAEGGPWKKRRRMIKVAPESNGARCF